MKSNEATSPKRQRSYAEMTVRTGDPQVDEILDAMASACMRLESLSAELDHAHAVVNAELRKAKRDDRRIAEQRIAVEKTMSQIVDIENRQLPALLHLFQEVGHEKSVAGVAKNVEERLKAITRTSELDVAGEKQAHSQGERSPWETE